METIKQQEQNKVDALLKNCGVFFAFSDKQFAENKTPLQEGEKYVSIGGGGYMPKSQVKNFTDGMAEIRKWKQSEIKRTKSEIKEIEYELSNHECYYTNDISVVVDMFKGVYSEKMIRDIFVKNCKIYANDSN